MNEQLLTTNAPYSQEAEEALIGALIVKPDALPTVANIVTAEDFYFVRHGYVFAAMESMRERGQDIDIVTLGAELEARKQLDTVGGNAYLMQLAFSIPTSMHATTYAGVVQRLAKRRRLMIAADTIIKAATDTTIPLEDAEKRADEALSAVLSVPTGDASIMLSDGVSQHYDRLQADLAAQQQGLQSARILPLGLPEIDELIGQAHRGIYYLWGARTHMGKTSSFLTMLLYYAVRGLRTVFFTTETTKDDIVNRLIAMEMGVPSSRLAVGALSENAAGRNEWALYTEVISRMSLSTVLIVPAKGWTPKQIANRVKAFEYECGVDAIFIDYIQRLDAGAHPATDRKSRMDYISAQMPVIAQKFNVPLHVAAQLSRDGVKNRRDKEPQLADFKESGNLEEDADVVIMLHRDGYYDGGKTDPRKLKLICRKNRVLGEPGIGYATAMIDSVTARVVPLPSGYIEQPRVVTLPARYKKAGAK